MNETTLRLKGSGYYIQITKNQDDEDMFEYPLIIEGVKLLKYIGEKSFDEISDEFDTIDEDDSLWEDITKQKGKYLKGKFIREQVHYDSITVEYSKSCEFDTHFLIKHEGEFNPKLLQLMKSDYELTDTPYGIFADVIKYNDDKCLAWEDDLYCDRYNSSYELEWDEHNQMWM